jgi:hypothetical protein
MVVKWRLQFIFLVMLMAFLILGGIHLAEQGTQRLDGFTDGPSQSFHITRENQGEIEMTVLGKQYSVKE